MQKLMDRDLLAGVVLFVIGAIALANAGSDLMNWAFPLMAAWFIMFAAVLLVARALFAGLVKHTPDIISLGADDRTVSLDVVTFLLIGLGYLLVLYGLGFWLASFLMLVLVSIYLTRDKTRHNLALAIGVPLATCVVAYLVFEQVFYVPVPEATWWPLAN